MKISILASGSNGNATYIETKSGGFLIDNGLSFKMLSSRFENSNNNINNLNSIFITHEHVDHVCGVKVLLKKMPLKCYLTEGTYQGLHSEIKGQIDLCEKNLVSKNDIIEIDGCKVTIIQTHHDAKEPIGFVIEEDDKKVVYITDTGYVDQTYYQLLSNANLYIMESNYDVEMLWSSGRPFELKKRIDGDYGHMSNVDSAILLSRVIGPNTKDIVFAHISDDCNYYHMPQLILKEHKKIYDELGVDYSKISFAFGDRKGVTGVYEL